MIHPTIVLTLVLVAFALGIILTTLDRNNQEILARKSQIILDQSENEITFIAPIDMKPGDDVDIEKEECGHWIVTKIIRDYKTIWER